MAEGQGRSSEQGVKLLYIRDYLHKYTNKEHPKSAKDIIEYLASKGIKAERKTIYNDILRLQTDFQEPIEYNPKKWGYYITKPQFEPYELRLLIDSLQSNMFAAEDEIVPLIAKVKELADIYTKDNLSKTQYINYGIFHFRRSFVKTAEILQQAINMNKKVSYRSYERVPGREYTEEASRGRASGIQIINPISLIWDNGNYWVKIYQRKSGIYNTYGISGMEDIKILSEDRDVEDNVIFNLGKIPTTKEEAETQYRSCVISLLFPNSYMSDALKFFGHDLRMIPEGKHFRVNVRVTYSRLPQLYGWMAGLPEMPVILSPQSAIDGMTQFLEDAQIRHKKNCEKEKL